MNWKVQKSIDSSKNKIVIKFKYGILISSVNIHGKE